MTNDDFRALAESVLVPSDSEDKSTEGDSAPPALEEDDSEDDVPLDQLRPLSQLPQPTDATEAAAALQAASMDATEAATALQAASTDATEAAAALQAVSL